MRRIYVHFLKLGDIMKDYLNKFRALLYTPILIYVFLLIGVSLIAIYSSMPLALFQYPDSGNFVIRQLLFFGVGAVALICILFFGMEKIRLLRWWIYGFFMLLLLLLFADRLIPGISFSWVQEINGATRWIDLGLLSLQPSEFMRIALILVIADVIQKHNDRYPAPLKTSGADFKLILKTLALIALPAALIFFQPDSGITILILVTTAVMLLAAGIKWRYIITVAAIAFVVISIFITTVTQYPDFLINTLGIEAYQISRFNGWFDPFASISGDGRQLAHGLIGMGTGGLFGHGIRSGVVFFPEAHTDFIFSVIGKDFGLIGAMAVVTLYALFNFEILNTAALNRNHYNGSVCAGIFASLMAQQFWNIGMTIGILPISGVTLPFISHGGSSVLASMILLGLILSSYVEGAKIKRFEANYQEHVLYLKTKAYLKE